MTMRRRRRRNCPADHRVVPVPRPNTPTFGATQSSGSSSLFNVSSNAPTVQPDDVSATLQPDDDSPGRRSNSPAGARRCPRYRAILPRRHPSSSRNRCRRLRLGKSLTLRCPRVGQNTLSVRFEINIVKVRAKTFFFPSFCYPWS